MTEKSFGVLTAAEMQAAINAPAGGALKIIRKKDPHWGTGEGSGAPLAKYRVGLTAEFTSTEQREIEVYAADEEEAKKLAYLQADDIDWDGGTPDDVSCRVLK